MAEDFRESLYTIDEEGHRCWVYPNVVSGYFLRLRTITAIVLIGLYVAAPWVRLNGRQAFLFDIPNRKFILFGSEFWATDTLFLMLTLGALGLSLFLFTAMFGRVWCGWACPETVFLEFVFRPIERLIEGNAVERKRLDAAPWSFGKVWKKVLKHAICAAIAWGLATTFLAYFIGAQRMIGVMVEGPFLHPLPAALTIIFMGVFAFQFGWFREQFCTVVCPYARFQSVLLDADSLTVGYDARRGEPRAKLGERSDGGDCIDCRLCVRVCPTGIDIRNGSQLECVACTQCIDACDSVMARINRPLGLIRYDTENGLLGKARRYFRPRVVVYSLILIGYAGLFAYFLSVRALSEVQVLRAQREAPFHVLPDGRIGNHYELRISNKSSVQDEYTLSTLDNPSLQFIVPLAPFPVGAGDIATLPLFVNFEPSELQRGRKSVEFEVSSKSGFRTTLRLTLLGPDS